MAGLNHLTTTQPWQQDDPEDLLGFDMDDEELFFDEIENDEEPVEIATAIPSWRRIEMAHEDRYLKEMMADFDDYDKFEDYGHHYNPGFSH